MVLIHNEIKDPGERQIVTGMIVSDTFLQEISQFYQPHLMEVDACRTVAGWCLDFYQQYRKAPLQHIQGIFEAHARNGLDPDEASIISIILTKASEEFERTDHFNVDYALDTAEKRFKHRSLLALADDIKSALASPLGGPLEAEKVIEEYHRVERPRGSGICPLSDRDAIKRAFADQATPLFRFGGAFGQMINPMCTRASFLAFLAPPKRGKSWMLMELSLKAASAGCNVVHFESGDMTEDQWLRRFHIRISFKPYRHHRPEYIGVINIPHLLDPDGTTGTREVVVEPLDYHEAVKTGRDYLKKKVKKGQLKLSTHPSKTLTLSHVRTQLDIWERVEGFIPDVLVFDYADILASDKGAPKDFRHQQNEIWAGLRGLSQERHALILTASQSDAKGMESKQLSMQNFSEDMRKLAHVTGMYGLNQTPEEKKEGFLRVNEIVVREGDFDNQRSVTLLQALHVGRPVLDSFWTPREPM